MFKEKFAISEIQSIIYVKPPANKCRYSNYGPNMNRYELIYKISGETITNFNGKTLKNIPGTIEYLPKCENIDYRVERINSGDCIDIFFDTDFELPHEAFVLNASTSKTLSSLFYKIYQIWNDKPDGYYVKCMSLFYEIIYELKIISAHYLPENKYKKIEKGIEYLRLHCFDKKVDYYEPAALCGISYTYFKRIFLQKYSISPIQYITAMRMERAQELLITDRYTITEIADICGFENVYYFSNVFKKHFGVSPKNYKVL